MAARDDWRTELAGWAIPPEILDAAPESPYGFPAALFQPADEPIDSPSRQRALEVLPAGGSVLDVGCGGGAAGLALVPPAGSVTGVDSSPEMLADFAAAAERRRVNHREVLGGWPEVAGQVPAADVVVCHHVAYNVPDLPSFAIALSRQAHCRVVLELTQRHPLVRTGALWRRFHGLARPVGPTADLAARVLAEAGIVAVAERFQRPPRAVPQDAFVAFTRRRLCLPPDREPEVAAALAEDQDPRPRELVALWWDVQPGHRSHPD